MKPCSLKPHSAHLQLLGKLLESREETFVAALQCMEGFRHHCKGRSSPKVVGNVSETQTPTTCLKSTAVHLQFVRQYAPHLYRRTFLASKLRRKGSPVVRLPFVLQYASHLYCSTPPICTAVLLENTGGWGHRNVSEG